MISMTRTSRSRRFVWFPLLVTAACLGNRPLVSAASIEFNRDVLPILSDRCFSCHGPDSASRKADLRLDQRDAAVTSGAITPGDLKASTLVERILSDDPDLVMPPATSPKPLTKAEQQILAQWIEEGAVYQKHWSFISIPKQVPVPAGREDASEIDRFIESTLAMHKLERTPPASHETWLRRVTFNLTGLPPTINEIDAFLADNQPGAEGRVVDRLMASDAFAERMTNDWLDVARYADTFGYQADREMHMWPWRDWVIRSFKENLSYRDFVTQQLAGDLLPNPTQDMRIATGFNRLHRQTNEGGSVEAEFRAEYVSDRVRTFGTAFLGMTLECCRCHTHKFDPITQHDFYRLSDFFAQIDESGLYSHFTETAPTPALLLYKEGQQTEHQRLKQAIADLAKKRDSLVVNTPPDAGATTLDAVDLPSPIATFAFEEAAGVGGTNTLVQGRMGKAIEFGGDDAFVCSKVGEFGRTNAFSLSLWVRPKLHKPRMVVAHCSQAAEDSAFRGYSLTLDEGHPVASLVHFWPGNAIQVRLRETIPLHEWTHLAFVYDGSSTAAGVELFVNGRKGDAEIIRDQLTRDIRQRKEWGDSPGGGLSLSLGARFRDIGFQDGAIDDLNVYSQSLTAAQVAKLAGAMPNDPAALLADHRRRTSPEWTEATTELQAACEKEDAFVSGIRQMMTMEITIVPRKTHVLNRGAYDAPGDFVEADTPPEIMPFGDRRRDRLGLAEWLFDDANPLTARLAVNRLWMLCFGRGLVATPEDFGIQGARPSHPELLDWLARDLMDHGWNLRRTLRQIVLSKAYCRKSLSGDGRSEERDPENAFLSRGPRVALPSEAVRDGMLAASGLLVRTVGGPSVYPYQPAGLWEEAGTGKSYPRAHGADLYRRSMYSFWRRTAPPPGQLLFGAPTRETCVALRERTRTPLQALLTLNAPEYVEGSRVLAEQLLAKPLDDRERLVEAFRRLLTRRPVDGEVDVLVQLLEAERSRYRDHPDRAASLLKTGDTPAGKFTPEGRPKPESSDHAAWTIVILTLFNHDESLTLH